MVIICVFSYPDFGDGLLHAFVVNLPEGDRVKLTLVEVRHCPVSRFLTQRFGCLKSILKVIPKMQTIQKRSCSKYQNEGLFSSKVTYFSFHWNEYFSSHNSGQRSTSGVKTASLEYEISTFSEEKPRAAVYAHFCLSDALESDDSPVTEMNEPILLCCVKGWMAVRRWVGSGATYPGTVSNWV